MNCKNCGTPLSPEQKFCPNCGSSIENNNFINNFYILLSIYYKTMQDLEHENYILNSILKSSPSSENFSFEEYRKVSPAYYNDLKQQLLVKYLPTKN